MEQVLERRMRTTTVDLEAQKHNEQISERYRQLFSAEATQFSSSVAETRVEEPRASVSVLEREKTFAPVETPVFEQAPQVTEFVHEKVTNPVFTVEKFERVENVATTQEVIMPTFTTPTMAQEVAIAQEISYSLSPMAKIAMAVAGVLAVGMMSLIGVNSQIIRQKTVRLNNLQQQKRELISQNAELEERIKTATSEDTIRAWAESQINQ